MKTTFNPDEILLYWSGELDPDSAGAVEQQLESNAAARDYFEELKEMAAAVDSLPRVESSHSFADVAAAGVPEKEITFPIPFRWLAVAAALVLLLVVGLETPQPRVEVRTDPVVSAPKEPEKLSDRLFAYQRHAMPEARIRAVQLRARNLRSQLTSQRNSLNRTRTKS